MLYRFLMTFVHSLDNIITFITSLSDECPSFAYECDNSRCIDKDISCNGFNSCGDNSSCSPSSSLSTESLVGIAIGCTVTVLFLVAMTVFCTYNRRHNRSNIIVSACVIGSC